MVESNRVTKSTKNKLKQNNSRASRLGFFWRALEVLPVSIPVALATFGSVATLFLLAGKFHNYFVWPIGMLAATIAVTLVHRSCAGNNLFFGSGKERRLFSIVILLFIGFWAIFNMRYASQNIFVYRDPGIYTVTSAVLVDDSDIEVPTATVFGENNTLIHDSAGFGVKDGDLGEISAQGLHLLPALAGLVGQTFGERAIFLVNPLIGAIALLSVYGFAMLIIKPRWAFFAVLVLGLTLPMIHFSRGLYTEPLAMLFTFGALALLFLAQKSGRKNLWFLAGLMFGAGLLTRVDAIMTLIALSLFLTIYLATSRQGTRRDSLVKSTYLATGAFITALLGWLDLTLLSTNYFNDLWDRDLIPLQLLALLGVWIVGAVVLTVAWSTKAVGGIDRLTKGWRFKAVAILILVFSVVATSRPLWFEDHNRVPSIAVENLQRGAGVSIEPTRIYSEQSVNWVTWYLGPLILIFALAGIIIASKKVLVDRVLLWLPVLLVFSSTAVVYIMKPSIYPDQIWAMRRFLPVVMPGLLIFAVVALERFSSCKLRGYELGKRHTSLLLALILFVPLLVSLPFIKVKNYSFQYDQITKVCSRLPDNAAVVITGTVFPRLSLQTIQAFCDVPSVIAEDPKISDLSEVATTAIKNGHNPIILAVSEEASIIPGGENLSLASTVHYEVIPPALFHPPRSPLTSERTILLGQILPDGRIAPMLNQK